jgi:hypothetical protein
VLASDAVMVVAPLRATLPRSARPRAIVVPNSPAEDSFLALRFSEGDGLRVNLSGFVSFRRNLEAWGEVSITDPAIKLDLYGNVADSLTAAILERFGMGPISSCSNTEAIARMADADVVS